MNLLKGLGLKAKVLCNEPLYRHTTFKIGGPVKIWAEPEDIDGLLGLLEISKTEQLPIFLIGEGSNLLVRDEGLEAMAICLGNSFQAGRGLQKFILDTIECGYTGLEFTAGIPGSIGGAVRMNAGAGLNGPWLSDFIERLKVCDLSGAVRYMEKDELKFGYRQSNLKDFIILEAVFNLKKAEDKEGCKKRYRRFLREKKNTQELSMPSAGCVFKNPRNSELNAGQLIEGCGLKQRRIGDAMVSNKHANFIVNMGKATFNDVMGLIELIKKTVHAKYKITLETEIECLRTISI